MFGVPVTTAAVLRAARTARVWQVQGDAGTTLAIRAVLPDCTPVVLPTPRQQWRKAQGGRGVPAGTLGRAEPDALAERILSLPKGTALYIPAGAPPTGNGREGVCWRFYREANNRWRSLLIPHYCGSVTIR